MKGVVEEMECEEMGQGLQGWKTGIFKLVASQVQV